MNNSKHNCIAINRIDADNNTLMATSTIVAAHLRIIHIRLNP